MTSSSANTKTELRKVRSEYLGEFIITRYCSCVKCCNKDDGITSTGTRASYGTVAVDPKVIPLGKKLVVGGFPPKGKFSGVFRAEDIGSAIKGRKIDIWHWNHKYCLQWGKQRRKVWVIRDG